jgi:AcrR family transcriptional regulator
MSATPSLRERKKAMTRAAIQEQALRLFLARGYDRVTVEEIAAVAHVSHMTFFRYFPTKEDVVLSDEYDALIVERIRERPASEPDIERVRRAIWEGLDLVYAANRDALLARTRLILGSAALRARQWEQQRATVRLIATALDPASGSAEREPELRARVVAAACLAAMTTAVEVWAECNGAGELPDLIDQSFAALETELSVTHG